MTEHPAVCYLRQLFGPSTNHPVFLCSLPNDKSGEKAGVRSCHSREASDIITFCNRWGRPGRGVYYAMSTIAEGCQRNKENCLETAALIIDVDFKDIELASSAVENAVASLRLPPTGIIRSGHGLHVIWQFKEALPTQEYLERIESCLRRLADVVGGDLAVAHPAALLRLPGTHNSKFNEWREVVVLSWSQRFYELDDLEDWLDEQSPVIRRKTVFKGGNGAVQQEDNPYLAIARSMGFRPPIDVAQRLEQMRYQGVGDAAIHQTQLQVSASLVRQGVPQQEIIDLLLHATRIAVGDYGSRWNWAREERN